MNLTQLATAKNAVYILSNYDGTDCEFLPLSPTASDAELAELKARWSGRGLQGLGIACLVSGIPTVVLKEEPDDFMTVVRLTAAYSRHIAAPSCPPVIEDDSLLWLERLYGLSDPRGA